MCRQAIGTHCEQEVFHRDVHDFRSAQIGDAFVSSPYSIVLPSAVRCGVSGGGRHHVLGHSRAVTYDITVESRTPQPAAVIRARVTRDEIADLLNSAFPEIFGVLQVQAVPIAGPPFARYGMGEEAFDVTAGFPVAAAVEPEGRVEMGGLPGGEVATTLHVGSYEGLAGAFDAVTEWVAANGRRIAGDPWESYLDGPEVSEPRTMVCFPLEER
ncbi:MAG: AraC family transcriptional regulator [Actinobacteria bacterium]|nr:MAG: AraC family transcriptional regulator [Actinomycetota bacterium]